MILKFLIAWLRWRARRVRQADFIPGAIRSVAVFEVTRLGDFVSILPALRRLRHNFPRARVHCIVDAGHAPLLNACEPGIDVISVHSPFRVLSLLRALRAVRGVRPDLSCSMSPSGRNAALALASGSRFTVGYLGANSTLTPFLSILPVEFVGFSERGMAVYGRENIQVRSWKVLQALGIHGGAPPDAAFHTWDPPETLTRRRPAHGHDAGSTIVIHPFAGWGFRSWPMEFFERLTRGILEALPHRVTFVCHAVEGERLTPLVSAFRGEDRVTFAPSEDILATASLLRDADVFIGNDSGPLHLAALLRVPLVGLFGPAPPELTAPLFGHGTFLYRKVACSPCAQIDCIMPGNSCMRGITPDEVLAAVLKRVRRPKSDGAVVHG